MTPNMMFEYDAIPDHDVTLRTPYVLHPSWQTEGRTFLIMDEGQHMRNNAPLRAVLLTFAFKKRFLG